MGDMEAPENNRSQQAGVHAFLPSKEFISSRKGQLLVGEVVLSFITFVCFAASTPAAFVVAPFLEFLAALFFLFAYSSKFSVRFKGFQWSLLDFLRCVSASIIFFIMSIISLSKYSDGASKAAGVFGLITTIIFVLDFYFLFKKLKGGNSSEDPRNTQDDLDADSD